VIDDILYRELSCVATAMAAVEFRTYKAENGRERLATMCKRLAEGEKWCFETGDGKVYLQDSSGRITPIVRMEWWVASLTPGENILMLMTKGINQNAKWSGRHAGKRYIEK
jgi:hypothetical protein